MVSDVRKGKGKTDVQVTCDLNMFVSELEAGEEVSYELGAGRQAYVAHVSSLFASVLAPACPHYTCISVCVCVCARARVCVCVCVCVW
jgi:hypothetical protein